MSAEQLAAIQKRREAEDRRRELARRQQIKQAFWRTVPERYRQCELGNYVAAGERQARVLEQAREFAQHVEHHVAQATNLLLVGTVGTGKDHLAIALLRIVAEAGRSAMWRSCRELYTTIADSYREDRTHTSIYRQLAAPSVLCLSDPIEDRNWSDAKADMLAKIVHRRYDLGRPTWITANLTDADHAIRLAGAEVWDRLRGGAVVLWCNWGSYRTTERESA